ncbi:MAG: DUF362 domain-containing protein [Desulfomonilaceae bacterium]
MEKHVVGVSRYTAPGDSVREVVELAGGLGRVPKTAKVFIKPNVVFWSKSVTFPKWGVITTSRVVADVVKLLVEHGLKDITIGEGTVVLDPKDKETQEDAYRSLGYRSLEQQYGIKCVNIFDRPFEKVDLGGGLSLNFNTDILNSDLVIDLPVLKTHAQAVVSLGIKNLKGTIDINSRKKCHNVDGNRDLHFYVSKLSQKFPNLLTIIDGIYSNERGPAFDGKARRSDLLIASWDILSADFVGSTILGHSPEQVPHLVHAANYYSRPMDLSDIEIRGLELESVISFHEHTFPYTEDNSLPLSMAKMGIAGITYPKYDSSLCTYCSGLTGAVLTSIAMSWKGSPWPDVEVLTGKLMKPTPGKKSVFIGKCLFEANKGNPDLKDAIFVKTCPPDPKKIIEAFNQSGVELNPEILMNLDKFPAVFMKKYANKPEFDEFFYQI